MNVLWEMRIEPGDIIEGLDAYKGMRLRVLSTNDDGFKAMQESTSDRSREHSESVLKHRPDDSLHASMRAAAKRDLEPHEVEREWLWIENWVAKGFARVVKKP